MHRLTVTKEQTLMWNGYQPYRRGIRFFPHIFPIAFPLIFPLGIGLALWLFHLLLPVIGLLLVVGLVLFIIRAIGPRNSGTTWNSLWNTGHQWQQRFTSPRQQQPYYQPSAQAGQEQSSQSYGQGYNPEQPYYQPSAQAGSQPYGQNYHSERPSHRPTAQSNDFDQPQAQYPERMPPMQQ